MTTKIFKIICFFSIATLLSASASFSSQTAAVVNGEVISVAEVYKGLESIPQFRKMELEVLRSMILSKLLLQESKKQGIKISKKQIDEAFQDLTKKFKSKEEMQAALKQRGLTKSVMKGEIKKQLAVEEVLKRFDAKQKIEITDEEAMAYYKEKPEYFQRPEAVKLSSISVKSAPDAKPEDIAKAKAKIEAAKKELKEGKNFEDVVAKYSEDVYKKKKGLMGFVTKKDNLAKTLIDAAFSLNTGETSDIVKTVFGFHILLVSEKKAAMQFSFEDVKDRIRENLHDSKLMKKRAEYQKKLSKKASIEIFINPAK